MLERIESLLGKKVRWATKEEVEQNVKGEKESETFILENNLSIDTVDMKEESEQELYYILLDNEFKGYVIAELKEK